MPAQTTRDPPEKVAFISDPLLGGMNSRISAQNIRADQAAELINVSLDDPSEPRKREGFAKANIGSSGMRNIDLRIAALYELDLGPGSRLMLAAVPGDEGGVYMTVSPSSSAWVEAKLPDGRSLNIGADSAVIGRGHDAVWVMPPSGINAHAIKTDGTIIDCGDENGSPPREAVDVVSGMARNWIITRDATYFSKLYPSADDLEEKTAFDRQVDWIKTAPGSGSTYVAGRFWRGQSLMLFGDRQIDRIAVNPADPLDSSIHVAEPQYGCSARNSIVSVGESMFFLDQFYEFRELRQTIQASISGVSATPVSEAIRTELSVDGRINKENAHKCWSALSGPRVLLFYPRDASTEPDAVAVYNSELRTWEGIWLLGRPMSSGLMSDIDGPMRLYSTDGGVGDDSTAMLYRWGGVHSDDGASITYRETTRAFTGTNPRDVWVPEDVAYTVDGDVGAQCDVSLRTGHNDALKRISTVTIAASPASSFPLVDPVDFSVVDPTDFPLIDASPQVMSQRTMIYAEYEGDGPLYKGIWPLFSMDAPIFDAGYGAEPGQFMQIRIEETSRKSFVRKNFALSASPDRIVDESGYADLDFD